MAILEAGATGLPVISTRHAGIPEVVIEGRTGFWLREHDVEGMAKHMLRIAREPLLAAAMGKNSRDHIAENFSIERRLGDLWNIIDACIKRTTRRSKSNGEQFSKA